MNLFVKSLALVTCALALSSACGCRGKPPPVEEELVPASVERSYSTTGVATWTLSESIGEEPADGVLSKVRTTSGNAHVTGASVTRRGQTLLVTIAGCEASGKPVRRNERIHISLEGACHFDAGGDVGAVDAKVFGQADIEIEGHTLSGALQGSISRDAGREISGRYSIAF
jgi:hypothetical protein